MAWTRAALVVLVAAAVGLALVSGGSGVDPRTPPALPGLPPPFLGTAVAGSGEMTAAVDAYGDVVDLRATPAGAPLIDNPSDRQAAGSVDVRHGIVPRVRLGGGPALPLWRADSTSQRYLPGTNVVRNVAEFGLTRVVTTVAATGSWLAMRVGVRVGPPGEAVVPSVSVGVTGRVHCARERRAGQLDLLCRVGRAVPPVSGAAARNVGEKTGRSIRSAITGDREWLDGARLLDSDAPRWARRMYERSLLTMRALTDRRNGAVAAGARDGWAYVWPRDAGAVAIALAASGYPPEARHIARFLSRLDLDAAARFEGAGDPVPGRAAQGDAAGWAIAAGRAAGLRPAVEPPRWRNRADYHEGDSGDFLGNAIATAGGASGALRRRPPRGPEATAMLSRRFGFGGGLVRRAGDPESGLDSAAAWAVRPFSLPGLRDEARRTLHRLAGGRGRFGITPGEGWRGGVDPWSAPTAWSAWGLAALAAEARERGNLAPARSDRRAALALVGALRRSATPAGALPERVDARTGVPRSTTPLAWSHAFAALALLELWPDLSSSRGGEAGNAR